MKSVFSCLKTAVALAVIAALLLAVYLYMIVRPISYGMDYRNVTEYDGGVFEGAMTFHTDSTMSNRNTNLDEIFESRYYYSDGYIFFTLAETDEDYAAEVAAIEDNFEEAVQAPFYADRINAFRLVAEEGDGYSAVYTCTSAIVLAAVGGAVELVLIGLAAASFVLYRKNKDIVEF